MRTFTYPAAYRPYIESSVALAIADIGRDAKRRADGDYETIPSAFVDRTAEGQAVVIVGAEATEYEAANAAHALFTPGAIP